MTMNLFQHIKIRLMYHILQILKTIEVIQSIQPNPYKTDNYNHTEHIEYNSSDSPHGTKTNTYDNNTQNVESSYEVKTPIYKNSDNLQEASYSSAINNEYSAFDYKTESTSSPESRMETAYAQRGVDETITGSPSTSTNIEQDNSINFHGIKTSSNQNNEQFSQLSLFVQT